MPTPTIPGLYRISILWGTLAGLTPVNVFHVFKAGSNEAAIGTDVAAAILAGTSPNNMFAPMTSNIAAQSLHVTELNGTSPGIDHSLLGSGISGGSTGEYLPQVAAVASFKTAQKGARGRGRMYVGPVTESSATNGVLASSKQTEMLSAFGAFETSLAGASIDFVVASYAHADYNVVTSVRIDTLLGTQRRRQDQLR
jgi:hypothetical protein